MTQELTISAIHVHHGLQMHADKWTAHCATVCSALGVPLEVEHVTVANTDEGIEAAARTARYRALRGHVDRDDVLLTAHQQDDQAETLLLQLLRGTGIAGLAAMPAIAPFSGGQLARPLLGFTRAELTSYAEANQLRWLEDPMNEDMRYARSFLRMEIMPLLKRRWPNTTTALVRSARHAAEASALLEELARADLASADWRPGWIDLRSLQALNAARRRNVLRFWLKESGFKAPNSLHLAELEKLILGTPRSRHGLLHWPGTELRRYREGLHVMRPLDSPRDFSYVWDLSGPVALPEIGCILAARSVHGRGLSQNRLLGRVITVKSRQGAKRCSLPGRGSHELRKLFQEAGVPPWERERMPFLYIDGILAAVGDRWVCAPFAARPDEAGWSLCVERQ